MLKINVGWSQERLAQQLAFGLTEGNLELLKSKGPIAIAANEIGLDDGNNFGIFAAEQDPEAFTEQLAEMLEGRVEGEQPVMNVEETFWVVPVPSGPGVTWLIGLHEVALRKLREGGLLTFRARMISGEGQNVEVNIFWAKDGEGLAKRAGVDFEYGVRCNVEPHSSK